MKNEIKMKLEKTQMQQREADRTALLLSQRKQINDMQDNINALRTQLDDLTKNDLRQQNIKDLHDNFQGISELIIEQ